jgi:serine protease Do
VAKRLLAFVATGVGALVAGCSLSGSSAPPADAGVRPFPPSFASIAAAAKPAVVHVSAVRALDPSEAGRPPALGPKASKLPSDLVRRSLGSGFFISDDGFVVTNRHVVADAEEIVIRLASSSTTEERGPEFPARLIGADVVTDLALLKIEPATATPSLQLGDSNELEVGDWVLAVGNPFGLDQTVTAGIVSSTSRSIGDEPTEGYIQTDAPINPGNSGGPLLNLDGEVVGVNLAIVSSGSGSVGIGFATPSNLAKPVVEDLRREGKVVRGWVGIDTQDLTGDLASAFHIPEHSGVLVADVVAKGPAAEAGLRRGDVILSIGGRVVGMARQVTARIAMAKVGEKLDVRILRAGREESISLPVGNEPAPTAPAGGSRRIARDGLGVTVEPVTKELSQDVGTELVPGLFVDSVVPGGLADKAGVTPGDVIQELNGEPMTEVAALKRAVEKTPPGEPVLIVVRRGESSRFLAAKK